MKKFKIAILSLVLVMTTNFMSAQTAPVETVKIANGGFDLVAYFTENHATTGNYAFAVDLDGVKYLFSSKEHQEAFKANPDKFMPQCDGFCAWGIAEKGTKFSVNPETFKVVNGKLYLFFNGDFKGSPFNTLTEWNKDEKSLLSKLPKTWEQAKKQ